MRTRLKPWASMVAIWLPEALTQKAPSPASAPVFPSPRMANSRSGRASSRESQTSCSRTGSGLSGMIALLSRYWKPPLAVAVPRSARIFSS